MNLHKGLRIHNYIVDSRLGEGGMGEVWKAHEEELGRTVALKILKEAVPTQADERFLREATLLARLNHPHIVTIYSTLKLNGQRVIAMEYLDGGSLQQGGFTHSDSIRHITHAASALAYAHSEGIIHRDIKPENILLTTNKLAKVSDFGLARQLAHGTTMTAQGMVMGTPGYIAPEQLTGGAVEGKADVYALGSTLYYLTTGKLAFIGESYAEVFSAQMGGRFQKPRVHDATIDSRLEDIIMAMLATDPSQRPSASEVREQLDGLSSKRITSTRSVRTASAPVATVPVMRPTARSIKPLTPTIIESKPGKSYLPHIISGALCTAAAIGILHTNPAPQQTRPIPPSATPSTHAAQPQIVRTTPIPYATSMIGNNQAIYLLNTSSRTDPRVKTSSAIAGAYEISCEPVQSQHIDSLGRLYLLTTGKTVLYDPKTHNLITREHDRDVENMVGTTNGVYTSKRDIVRFKNMHGQFTKTLGTIIDLCSLEDSAYALTAGKLHRIRPDGTVQMIEVPYTHLSESNGKLLGMHGEEIVELSPDMFPKRRGKIHARDFVSVRPVTYAGGFVAAYANGIAIIDGDNVTRIPTTSAPIALVGHQDSAYALCTDFGRSVVHQIK